MLTETSHQPDRIESVEQLEEMLSEPTPGVVETLRQIQGDVIVLGVAGKMGPTLARMIKRGSEQAGTPRRVIGVSRFSSSSGDLESQLNGHDIETIKCDLLDRDAVAKLPDAPNVIFMAGMKFGATGNESLTWAMNAYLPAIVCERYASSRIAAFSTGNVYGLTPLSSGGSRETDPPNPIGEYAMSCLARERMFEHFAQTAGTPVSLIRLNYAMEMRYGVLIDLAQRIAAGETIDLTMGNANVIWQGDANAMTICSLADAASPAFILNVTGPELVSLRRTCTELAELMGVDVKFTGDEAADGILSNGQLGHRLYGYPRVSLQTMVQWVADWIKSGGETHGKPTKFEVRDGKF